MNRVPVRCVAFARSYARSRTRSRSLRAALESHGYSVRSATSGPAALEACATERPDVVLLDLGLPGLDGVETTIEILRQQGSSSPFGTDTDKVVQALADGFSDGTRAAMLVAVVFLALGVLGAVRVWVVARRTDGAPATSDAR